MIKLIDNFLYAMSQIHGLEDYRRHSALGHDRQEVIADGCRRKVSRLGNDDTRDARRDHANGSGARAPGHGAQAMISIHFAAERSIAAAV